VSPARSLKRSEEHSSETIREAVGQARKGKAAREALITTMSVIGDATSAEDFRGCQFLNAAAEYPDPDHPVRAVIDDHRTWLLGILSDLAADLGHPDPDHAARVLVLLVDGALQGGQFDDSAVVRETLLRAVEDVIPH